MDLYWQWDKTDLSMIHRFTTTATSQTARALLPRSSYPDSFWPRLAPGSAHNPRVYLSGRYNSPLTYWVPAHSLALSWALFPSKVWPLWLDQSPWYILLEYLYLFVIPLFISGVFQIYHVIINVSFFPTRAHTQYFLAYRARVQLVQHYTQHPASVWHT